MCFSDVFLLGVDTGILYPHKSLIGQPREFQLLVEARDGAGHGQLYDRATINVQILNVNEYKPTFIMPALSNATVEVTEVGVVFVVVICLSVFLFRMRLLKIT